MEFTCSKQIREDAQLRNSFNQLAVQTFGISFESWYQNGWWTDRYLPYVLTEHNRVVANVSVNRIDTVWKGKERRYIQLGTVMTAPEYRKQGLSKWLMEEVLRDWKGKSDAVYLYANNAVLDFYPKFGFVKEEEFQVQRPVSPRRGDFERLDMDDRNSRELLKRCYLAGNPFSELPSRNNFGLLMFYCGGFMKEKVFYSRRHDTVCIAQQDGETAECYDIFGRPAAGLDAILEELASPGTKKAALGFTPIDGKGETVLFKEEDTTLFVLAEKENLFRDNRVRLPALSHA